MFARTSSADARTVINETAVGDCSARSVSANTSACRARHGGVDVGLAVGGRDEQRLVLAAWHVDAALDQAPEIAGVRAVSQRLAVGQSTTGSGLKNSVIMLPTRASRCGTPAGRCRLLKPRGQPGARAASSRRRRRIAQQLSAWRCRRPWPADCR